MATPTILLELALRNSNVPDWLLLGVFTLKLPSACYAFPLKFINSLFKDLLIKDAFSVLLSKIP